MQLPCSSCSLTCHVSHHMMLTMVRAQHAQHAESSQAWSGHSMLRCTAASGQLLLWPAAVLQVPTQQVYCSTGVLPGQQLPGSCHVYCQVSSTSKSWICHQDSGSMCQVLASVYYSCCPSPGWVVLPAGVLLPPQQVQCTARSAVHPDPGSAKSPASRFWIQVLLLPSPGWMLYCCHQVLLPGWLLYCCTTAVR